MLCPHCGAPTRENDRFCPQCGGRIQELNVVLPTSETVVQPDIVAEASDTLLASESVDVQPASQTVDVQFETVQEPQPTTPAPLFPDMSQLRDSTAIPPATCAPDTTAKKGNNTVKWIIIAVAILVVACCCCMLVAALAFMTSDASSSSTGPINEFLRSFMLP